MTNVLIITSSQFGAGLEIATMARNELEGQDTSVRIRRVPELLFPQAIAEAIREIPEAQREDLIWADSYIFISQSHTGMFSASLKAFIDQHHRDAEQGLFLNRTFTAVCTSSMAHGGQERVIEDLNSIALTWGCFVVSPSTTHQRLNELNGNPLGLSFQLRDGKLQSQEVAAEVLYYHLERLLKVTAQTQDLIERS